MLQRLSEEIRECYRHASEAGTKADSAATEETKVDFLDIERRWLFLAHSYEFSERLSRFTNSTTYRFTSK
jgi:hypothetical protein